MIEIVIYSFKFIVYNNIFGSLLNLHANLGTQIKGLYEPDRLNMYVYIWFGS